MINSYWTSTMHQLAIGENSSIFTKALLSVKKNQLNTLLSHYSGSSLQEAEEVYALTKEFPYSQVLHSMAARSARDHNLKNSQSILQLAAVHSTDRSVLKEIMSGDYTPVEKSQSIVAEVTSKKESPSLSQQQVTDTIDYADELMADLKRLKELKHNFEVMYMDKEGAAITARPKQDEQKTETLKSQEVKAELPEKEKTREDKPKKKVRKTSKRQRLIALTKELEASEKLEKKKSAKKNIDMDPLIHEIKATKKKIKPENEKTKEQIELINQYIKTKPIITPTKAIDQEDLDLASTLKSGEFGDNIISETLAEILIRQGKKDKAIEVYKKLIWKFPQKKAYFAAQIDDLRK